jgi:hypothetical protein
MACGTPSDLLAAVQDRLGTFFRDVHSDEELIGLRNEYTSRKEPGFALIFEELAPDHVYAITLCLLAPRKGERPYVSVIDCRGRKAWKAYYSKWHELAHLLTLTSQTRLSFRRTHGAEVNDPEEQLMEAIAGDGAFLSELVVPHIHEAISFDALYRLRQTLCPEASDLASTIGFVHAWPTPCLYVRAEMALKRVHERARVQRTLSFHTPPTPTLRVVRVTMNAAAQRVGLSIPRRMRVPEHSAIMLAYLKGHAHLEAVENLSWWSSSTGGQLEDRPVCVAARNMKDHVQALITPVDGNVAVELRGGLETSLSSEPNTPLAVPKVLRSRP